MCENLLVTLIADLNNNIVNKNKLKSDSDLDFLFITFNEPTRGITNTIIYLYPVANLITNITVVYNRIL